MTLDMIADPRAEIATGTAEGELTLAHTDVRFHNPSPGKMSVEITFHNDGRDRAAATTALIGSAPLGAFVSWRPLANVRVPALQPGGHFVFRKDIGYEPPVALGTPDRVPPSRLLTAIAAPDPQGRRINVAADLLQLVGQGGVHWAGNLNIFVGTADVERHMAQALRVYPGQMNIAMFVVGSGMPDGYRFRMEGDAVSWNATLLDGLAGPTIRKAAEAGQELAQDAWWAMSHGFVLLALEPPADAATGSVAIQVRQRSTDKHALVEFSLDAGAAGPGCYVL